MHPLVFKEELLEDDEVSWKIIADAITDLPKGKLVVDELSVQSSGSLDVVGVSAMSRAINFILTYIYCVTYDNPILPVLPNGEDYSVIVEVKIDFESKFYSVNFILEDSVFGPIVGKRYINIISLIKAMFPISAITAYRNEFRFYPASKMES